MIPQQSPPCVDTEVGYNNAALTGPITIDKHGVLEMSGTSTIAGNVCIKLGGDLEIPSGSNLTINGTLCIEIESGEGYETEYENHTWANGGGSLTVNGTVRFAKNCKCDGCD